MSENMSSSSSSSKPNMLFFTEKGTLGFSPVVVIKSPNKSSSESESPNKPLDTVSLDVFESIGGGSLNNGLPSSSDLSFPFDIAILGESEKSSGAELIEPRIPSSSFSLDLLLKTSAGLKPPNSEIPPIGALITSCLGSTFSEDRTSAAVC